MKPDFRDVLECRTWTMPVVQPPPRMRECTRGHKWEWKHGNDTVSIDGKLYCMRCVQDLIKFNCGEVKELKLD